MLLVFPWASGFDELRVESIYEGIGVSEPADLPMLLPQVTQSRTTWLTLSHSPAEDWPV